MIIGPIAVSEEHYSFHVISENVGNDYLLNRSFIELMI